MLITFIGCPASGKTTTAAMLFAKLKEMGIATEFICEQARAYIAGIRCENGLKPEDPVTLTDKDQRTIMTMQWEAEDGWTTACGPSVIVVSDSSALNALLYMTEECRQHHEVLDLVGFYDPGICFYLPPLAAPRIFDPNRIHDEAASLKINSLIPQVLKEYAPGLMPIRLEGDATHRLEQALDVVLTAIMKQRAEKK
jgi:hypothetical protein